MSGSCPRCDGPTEPIRRDELTVHYRCVDPECSRAHPLYQGEHPAKFWVLVTVEASVKVAWFLVYLARSARRWVWARSRAPLWKTGDNHE